MGKKVSQSAVRSSLRDKTVISRSVEKSLAQESEISRLRHHVSVLSRRLHEAGKKITVLSDVVAAYCVVCGGCHDSTSCVYWNGSGPGVDVEFSGVVDVAPLEEEVAEVVVRLPAVASVAAPVEEVAEEVAVVVAEEAEEGMDVDVGAEAKGRAWQLVMSGRARKRQRERERLAARKRDERAAVAAGMHVWRAGRRVVPLQETVTQEEEVEVKTEVGIVDLDSAPKGPRGVVVAPRGPRAMGGVGKAYAMAGEASRRGYMRGDGVMDFGVGLRLRRVEEPERILLVSRRPVPGFRPGYRGFTLGEVGRLGHDLGVERRRLEARNGSFGSTGYRFPRDKEMKGVGWSYAVSV